MNVDSTDNIKYAFHLFAGSGGGILGDLLLGREIVGAVEIEEYQRQSLLARQRDGILPGFPIWDDVCTFRLDNPETAEYIEYLKSIKDELIICGGFPCFAEGTLILTEDGYKPIETVREGELVLTHKGRWKRVLKTMQRDGAELISVRGFGILPTYTTDEHPYWINNREWRKVAELDTDCYTTMPVPEEEPDGHTPEWWWLCGRYLADGWRIARRGRKYGRVVIACNDDKAEELESHIKAAGYNFTKVKERTCNKYHITRGDLYRDLEEFGHRAEGKKLTRRALCLDREKSEALWNGYMSGDGRNGKDEFTSVSPALCLGLALVAQKLGKPGGVYHSDRNPKCVIEGRVCNQRGTYMFRHCGESNSAYFDGDCLCKKLRSVNRTGILSRVYNIEVEDDNSYIANGAAVHNCQDISVAGKGVGIEGERSGLWTEMHRIIGEVRPRHILLENSPMLLTRGFATVARDLAEIRYSLSWGIMGADDVGAWHKRDRFWGFGVAED